MDDGPEGSVGPTIAIAPDRELDPDTGLLSGRLMDFTVVAALGSGARR